jgi:hypothetical protein
LGLFNVDFLSNSLQLVNFLNSEDPLDLPDWRMAPLIQMIQDYTRDRIPVSSKLIDNSTVLQIP